MTSSPTTMAFARSAKSLFYLTWIEWKLEIKRIPVYFQPLLSNNNNTHGYMTGPQKKILTKK